MNSTFSGIEIGKRSIFAHTQGLSTIGHNLSNASVEGYSRQRVEMGAVPPIYHPGLNRAETPGQLGQGVGVDRIERIRDEILEGRIVGRANGERYWSTRERYIGMLEDVYNEPTEYSVRAQLDLFWASWQELSIHPEEMTARHQVLQRGESLIGGIKDRYRSLREIRDMADQEVVVTVERINAILRDLGELNRQILKVEAVDDNPNDLKDRRDLLVKELSGLVNISIDNRDEDEFIITTDGLHLLQGAVVHPLGSAPDPQNEGYSSVVWSNTGEDAFFRGGQLAGLLEVRDGDIRGEIQKLDTMTINLVDLVNENHRPGYGLNGATGNNFFTEYPFINSIVGNYDSSGDGELDSTYIYRINGTNPLEPQAPIGIGGVMLLSGREGNVTVPYFPTDTVEQVIKRINLSNSEVVARLDRESRLTIRAAASADGANPDFVIRHVEDSGQFLVGYAGILQDAGTDGAFDWGVVDAVGTLRGGELDYAVAPLTHPSGWIDVNPILAGDPSSVAAGYGVNGEVAETGNATAAISIASLRNTNIILGRLPSFDEYFAEVIADIGLRGETAARAFDTESLIMKELNDMKEALSGVNMDEELAQMIKFQHGYNAAARFVTTVDSMLDTIINRMGV